MTTTTVITRVYSDKLSAKGIHDRLYRQGFPRYQMSVVGADGESADGIAARLVKAWVPEDAAAELAKKVTGEAAVVVVRATYKPLGAVRKANETFATSGALDVGMDVQQFKVKTPHDHAPSILKDHPRFLTMPPRPGQHRPLVSESVGLGLLKPHRTSRSIIPGGKMMAGGKVKSGRVANSAMSGTRRMSRFFWPAPLILRKERGLSVIEGGGHPFSRLLGWSTTS